MNERTLLVRFGADLSDFEKAIIQASKSGRAFAKELEGLGTTLTKSVTVPLAAIATASVAASETVDDAMDRIRIGTGATGDELSTLGDTFKSVFGQVPESAANVSTAITELAKRTGLGGDALADMSTQMLELSRVSGSEVGPLIESTQKAFASWGVETAKQSGELDFLFKVSQQTGVGVSTLSETLSGSGATLRALGLDFESSAALIGQFQRAGVSSETVIAGLTKGASGFAKAGVSMSDGLREAVRQITAAQSPTQAAQIAVEKFGKSGVAMADAIRKGALDVDGFIAKLRTSPETIHKAAADTAGLGEAFGALGNKVTLALEPLGVAITKVLVEMMQLAGQVTDNVIAPLIAAFGRLPEPVQSALVVMAGVAAAIGPAMVAIGGLISTFGALSTGILSVKATLAPALGAIGALFPAAAGMITGAWATVTGAFAATSGAVATVTGGIAAVGSALVSFAVPIAAAVAAIGLIVYNWDSLKSALISGAQAIKAGLAATWSLIADGASAAWSGIKALVAGAVDGAVSLAKAMGSALMEAAKSALGGFYGSVKGALESAASFASSAWGAIKSGASEAGAWLAAKLREILGSVGGFVSSALAQLSNLAGQAAQKAASIAQSLRSSMPNPSTPGGGLTGSSSWPAPYDSSFNPGQPGFDNTVDYASFAVSDAANYLFRGGSLSQSQAGGWAPVQGSSSSGVRDIILNSAGGYSGSSSSGVKDVIIQGAPSGAQQPMSRRLATYDDVNQRSGSSLVKPGFVVDTGSSGRLSDEPVNVPSGYTAIRDRETPYFADGGIITAPTYGLIGEAGPEAVIPLSRGRGFLDSLGLGGGGAAPINVHVHVSGSVATQRDIAETIRRELVRTGQRNGTSGVI